MLIRSKAPLRLGLAGGGTDVSPYSDTFGGSILNATINMYSYTFLEINNNSSHCIFEAKDLGIQDIVECSKSLDINENLRLHRAVYKRVMDTFNNSKYIPLKIMTFSDAPPGSGLGSSSTIVVSMLEAYKKFLSLPLGEYDLAKLAFEIERIDCGFAGGKQDQYAAAFGGFNFMEFYENDRVVINPLRIRSNIIYELESSIILYYTGRSRDSGKIITDQIKSSKSKSSKSLSALHELKKSSYRTKEMLLKGDIHGIASELNIAWEAKKATAKSVTNHNIDEVEALIRDEGAISLKVSGAGGGGFLMIFVYPERKIDVMKSLDIFDGHIQKFQFTNEGSVAWMA